MPNIATPGSLLSAAALMAVCVDIFVHTTRSMKLKSDEDEGDDQGVEEDGDDESEGFTYGVIEGFYGAPWTEKQRCGRLNPNPKFLNPKP